ncbi:MAG TPA: tetratricopeptide repeat protein [Planctomycetota bacterium]|nr:tetratricopeptide repeat protein [Planctomycetota bacterium]
MTTSHWIVSLVVSLLAPRADERALREAEQGFARGREALAAGDFEAAGRALEEALKVKPQHVDGWILLARAACRQAEAAAAKGDEEGAVERHLAKAEEAARRAVELDRDAPAAWAELGHVLSRAGSVEESIAALYQAEKGGGATVELLVDLSDDLVAARQAAADAGDDAGAASRLNEAKAVLQRAQRLADDQVTVARRLAHVCTMLRDDAGTLSALRRAALLKPDDTDSHEAVVAEAARQQKFDETIRFYSGLVDEPVLGHWYASRARELDGTWLYNSKHDYPAAAEQYRRAEEELVAAGRQKTELAPQVAAYVPTLRASRGAAQVKAEDFAAAEATLLSAIDLDPAHEGALKQLHALQDAMWTKFGGDHMPPEKFDEIRAFAAKLCLVEPERAENWNNYGFFAREAKRYEESNRAYRRAIGLEPDNARYLNDGALILLYHLDRDYDQARVWLEKSRKLAEAGINDEKRRTDARNGDRETLGDAYSNLINVVQAQGDVDYAKQLLDEFEQKLPKRHEVASWRAKLTPERVPPPAEPAKGDGKDDAKNPDATNAGGAPKAGGDAKPDAKPESDGEASDVTPEEGATGEEDD